MTALTALAAPFVPADATARVRVHVHGIYMGSGNTIVTLHVWGLAPNRQYGAHAHKFACGVTDPTAGGGHSQYVEGGVSDPGFANPDNEVWLDFTADSERNGAAQSVVGQGRPDGVDEALVGQRRRA